MTRLAHDKTKVNLSGISTLDSVHEPGILQSEVGSWHQREGD